VKNPPVGDKSKSSKKKSKKETEADSAPIAEPDDVKSQKGKKSKDKKEGKSAKKVEPVEELTSDPTGDAQEDEVEGEGEDDQTIALIKGFESSGDEDISGDEGFEAEKPVPTIPDSKKTKRKLQKLAKKRDTTD
jgi:nucleolar protein 15